MKLDKNYKVRVTPEQSREIHSLILLEIDDYEPLSAYLSINSFEVSGVSE